MRCCVVGQDFTYGVDRASDVLSPRAFLTQNSATQNQSPEIQNILTSSTKYIFWLYELVPEQKSFLLLGFQSFTFKAIDT